MATCPRGCDRELTELADDPLLPDHIDLMKCHGCGEVFRLDTETGELEVDA